MKETLQAAMLSLINSTVSTVQDGVAFLKQEIPDVIHQLLTWHMVESLLYFILPLIVFVLGCISVYLLERKTDKEIYNRYNGTTHTAKTSTASAMSSDGSGHIITGLIVVVSIGAITISLTHLEWLKILIAPKLYLLEYAATLIK